MNDNFRRAQAVHERSGDVEYAKRIESSEAKERWIEKNSERGIVEYMEDFRGNEVAEISIILQQAPDGIKDAVKAYQYIKSHFEFGKLNNPEYAELGRAVVEWFYQGVWADVEAELGKEYDKLS